MKKLIIKSVMLAIFIIPPVLVNAQTIADSIFNNFTKQSNSFPQEKIYAQIDKPYYVTGENIWFRCYLIEYNSHLPDTTSRYIYGELINPIDTVVCRVKIRPVEGAYHGYINLPEDLPTGQYQLRFYTRFMESLGDSYFFKRTIQIGDPLTALYRTEPKFEYKDDKKIEVELRFIDIKSNTLIEPDEVRRSDDKGELRKVKQDKDTTIRFSLKSPVEGRKSLYIEYDYNEKFHKEFIPVPHRRNYEVSFLPEGGYNVAGTINKIAFKAINSDGLGEDIEGLIINNKGDTLIDFKSKYKGMGLLVTNSLSDSLYAICRNKDGLEKKYLLPKTSATNIALQVDVQKSGFLLSARVPYNNELNDRPWHLIVQNRGTVLNVIELSKKQKYVSIPKNALPTGVIQFLLADENLNIVSERLIFNINKANILSAGFATDKQNYNARELVKGSVKLSGSPDSSVGRISVSVTDDKDVKPDTCVNILSTMLLTSELKGYVESPAYYFSNNSFEAQTNLDILMMTQGWSRYNAGDILKGKFETPEGYMELGQHISGIVKGGLLNKPAANHPVNLISSFGEFIQTTTDDKGRFSFQGFESPDTTSFIVQGTTKRGGNGVELQLEEEIFPASMFSVPFSFTKNSSIENYIEKADQNFTILNGMRMIYLKDVEITAPAIQNINRSIFSSPVNTRKTSKEFEKFHFSNTFQLFSLFSGVRVIGDKIIIRGGDMPSVLDEESGDIRGGGVPLILVDNIEWEFEDVKHLHINSIEEIEVVKDGSLAVFGMRGGAGAILITTKKGEVEYVSNKLNIRNIKPLGYQITKEFYSPQYETDEQKVNPNPDLRTTIYWNPDIKTKEDGTANINFYTSDAPTTYSVIIEGITNSGSLVYSRHKILKEE